jgi:endonuclease-3
MAGPNRSTLLIQLHKGLKKHYEPVTPAENRSVLESAVYGLLLENAPYSTADQIWSNIHDQFFDWNEVRVAADSELSELFRRLPNPAATAAATRTLLQRVFETRYAFDLEPLRKENLGKAAKDLENLLSKRSFAVSYVVQSSLGGHSIPVDRGTLDALYVLGLITKAEREAEEAPGLERAIPKNKGPEFSSLLHQLAADFVANPYSPGLHKILLEINPGAKDRLPKKPKKAEEPPKKAAKPSKPTADRARRPHKPAKKPAAATPAKRKPR